MDNNKAIQTIDLVISKRKDEVIKSLFDSNVFVTDEISDLELKNLILKQLKEGNGYLVVYLGNVIDKELQPEKYSNIAPVVGAAIIGAGSQLLGGFFGGGSSSSNTSQQASQQAAAEAAKQAAFLKQMQIAQSQMNAQKIAAETEIKNRRAKTSRTILTLSLIGGALLIATVSIVLILKKKK